MHEAGTQFKIVNKFGKVVQKRSRKRGNLQRRQREFSLAALNLPTSGLEDGASRSEKV